MLDSSPCSCLGAENLDSMFCESDSPPGLGPHHISQLDSESSSMCGSDSESDDSYEDLGNTDDLVSKLWWKDDDSDLEDSGGKHDATSMDSELSELDFAVQDGVNEGFFQLPESLKDLRKQLLGEYVLPTEPPQCSRTRSLTASETISLQHYVAWRKSNGTIYAYKLHADVLMRVSKVLPTESP